MCNIKYHIFSYIIFVVFLSPNKKEWSREAPLFYFAITTVASSPEIAIHRLRWRVLTLIFCFASVSNICKYLFVFSNDFRVASFKLFDAVSSFFTVSNC